MRIKVFLITAAALLVLLTSGCMEKYLVVKTNSGADLWVDGKKISDKYRKSVDNADEIRVPFEYYGTRELTLRKYGFWSRSVMVDLSTPWYQYFPIDFFTDLIIPVTITDERTATVYLDKIGGLDEESLMERARKYRQE